MHNNIKTRNALGGYAILWAILAVLAFPPAGHGDDLDLNKLFHESIPVSPSIGVVYAYADAMLQHGRDADFDRANARPATDCPRQAGFFIRTWAEAFAHTGDETFLKAIDVLLTHYEGKRLSSPRGPVPNAGSEDVLGALSMVIDCDGAARKVSQPLRSRLTTFAAGQDARFCSLPHDLKRHSGFVKSLDPAATAPEAAYTSLWDPRQGKHTTAAVGVMCMSRYENTGKVGYRELIVAAADAYLDSLPGDDVDAWPLSFGQAITLELAAWRVTAEQKYHARAVTLGEIAIEKFFGDSPLPRTSLNTDHYESTTGADTLVLSLAELHLSTLTITIVQTPANTIDR